MAFIKLKVNCANDKVNSITMAMLLFFMISNLFSSSKFLVYR